jgi:hypothetical protein
VEIQPVCQDAWSKDGYTQVAVAYLDMVGFSDYLRKDGTKVGDILGWLEELDRELSELRRRIYVSDQLRSAISSDTMLRALPIRNGLSNTLNTLISDVVRVQRRLTQIRWEEGSKRPPVLPLRGGISVGNLYWGERHIFGEALVNAADLEERVAGWPRVVIDPEIALDSDDEDGVRLTWPTSSPAAPMVCHSFARTRVSGT